MNGRPGEGLSTGVIRPNYSRSVVPALYIRGTWDDAEGSRVYFPRTQAPRLRISLVRKLSRRERSLSTMSPFSVLTRKDSADEVLRLCR